MGIFQQLFELADFFVRLLMDDGKYIGKPHGRRRRHKGRQGDRDEERQEKGFHDDVACVGGDGIESREVNGYEDLSDLD